MTDTHNNTSSALMETYRGAIYPWQCDHVGHMNVMWYVGQFDEATWCCFTELGLTPSSLRANVRGMAAVDQRIAYLKELHPGDTVAVRTGLIEVREKTLKFFHEMRLVESGVLAAVTLLTAVHMDTAARKSAPLPPDVADRAKARVISDYKLPW